MNILFLEPNHHGFQFPNMSEDAIKATFPEWVSFAKDNGLEKIKYFSDWDELKKESNKNKLSPVVICQDHYTNKGHRFRGMKKKGVRVFGINNYDYSNVFMAGNYVLPIKCDTCEELYNALYSILTDERFTKGIIKHDMLDFREKKS